MTPTEIRDELVAFAEEIGPRAYVGLDIDTHNRRGPVAGCIYPEGIAGSVDRIGGFHGDDFREVIDAMRAEWSSRVTQHRAARIKSMALSIIEITADQGQCTEAALRVAGFSQSEIEAHGADACATADHYGSKGPFSIVTIPGANAVAAE